MRINIFIIILLIITVHNHSAYLITSLYYFFNSNVYHTLLPSCSYAEQPQYIQQVSSILPRITHLLMPDHTASKEHLIPDYTTRIRHPILDHTTSIRHSHRIEYKRSSFNSFNSYQILCIYKPHAFEKSHILRLNGNIFKDLNTLEIIF